MTTIRLSTLAASLLIGLAGVSHAATTADKPTAKEAATPSTVKQTVKPSSGMPDTAVAQGTATKPTAKEAATPTTQKQTVQGPGMTDPAMPAGGSASKPGKMMKGDKMAGDKMMKSDRMKGDKTDAQSNAAVGSGSAGTVEGRVSGTTNSNSKGEAPKKP